MKFVDNLLEIKPEEIEHVSNKTPIQAIIGVRNSPHLCGQVVVVWEDGDSVAYSTDGRYNDQPEQRFIFKPVKREGWVNIYGHEYSDALYCRSIFKSEREAKKAGLLDSNYRSTIKVIWEE